MPHHLMSEATFNRMVEVNTINLPPGAREKEIERLQLIQRQGMYHVLEPERVKMLQNPVVPNSQLFLGFGNKMPSVTNALPQQYAKYVQAVSAAKVNNAGAGNANMWIIVNMSNNIMTIIDAQHLSNATISSDDIIRMMGNTVNGDRFIVGFVSPNIDQAQIPDTMRAYYISQLSRMVTPANDPLTMSYYNLLAQKAPSAVPAPLQIQPISKDLDTSTNSSPRSSEQ